MSKKIRTFSTEEFLGEFMAPDAELQQIIKKDYGRFFIVNVENVIKLSRLPIPPTRASTHTMIFLTSGVATMKIGFRPVKIHRNECLVVAAGQVFSYDRYEVNKGFICTFGNDFLVGKIGSNDLLKEFEFLTIWGNPTIKFSLKNARYVTNALRRISDEYKKNGLKNTNLVQSYFLAVLSELQQAYTPLSASKNKTAVIMTNSFKELLHKHIHTKHLVSDYASLLHVSPNHLNKNIKMITNKPATKWIDETLVLESKVLLFQTNNSIQEIASELGIHDPSYFSRLFKKYEGVTPMEYRRMIETS